jgi:hypothetical protein
VSPFFINPQLIGKKTGWLGSGTAFLILIFILNFPQTIFGLEIPPAKLY